MHVRGLFTVAALFSVSQTNAVAAFPILCLAFLYWLTGRYWTRIVPRLIAHPLLTGIDLAISFVILTAEGPGGPFFQSTVAASAVAGLLFRWRGLVVVSATQVACYFAALGYARSLIHYVPLAPMDFQTLLGQPAYYPIVGLVGVMLRRLFDQQAAADAARHSAELHMAASDERARLAREMHDSLAKTLRGIAMSAQALPTWVRKSPARAEDEAQRISSAAEIASREARDLIADLRDDRIQDSLANAVRSTAINWSEKSGVTVNLDLDDEATLPLLARHEILAIAKEALVNIDRHANATTVTITLHTADDLRLTVQDDGIGFAVSSAESNWLGDLARADHYGIVGMHERAKRVGGELSVQSEPGQGTTLAVSFPIGSASHQTSGASINERPPTEVA